MEDESSDGSASGAGSPGRRSGSSVRITSDPAAVAFYALSKVVPAGLRAGGSGSARAHRIRLPRRRARRRLRLLPLLVRQLPLVRQRRPALDRMRRAELAGPQVQAPLRQLATQGAGAAGASLTEASQARTSPTRGLACSSRAKRARGKGGKGAARRGRSPARRCR